MFDLLQILKNAIAVGSLYALIALGYTMVYGILKFINFAHSDIVVLGAWFGYHFARLLLGQSVAAPPWWAGLLVLILSMVSCGLVGFAIERLCYRPLRRAPRLNVLITAIGVSLLLQNFGQLPWVFGTQPKSMPPLVPSTQVASLHISTDADGTVNAIAVTLVDVTIFFTAAVLMVALEVLVYRTRLGTAMRAVSFNTETAALMGIPVDRVISITFVIGSMLAAAAGFLWVMQYSTLKQTGDFGWVLLGLKAFVAAVVGGIGNLRGAVLGGFLIALIEQLGTFYLAPSLRDVYVFAILILTLLLKPEGLLGSPVREKV